HKSTDVGECLAGDADTTYKTDASRGIFGIGNLDFGIEICGDSAFATLGQVVGGNLLDMHILLSQGMDHNFATQALNRYPVKDGGYFVHCEGTEAFDAANGVWRLARGSGTHGTNAAIKVVTPTALEEVAMDNIRARGFVIARTITREGGNTTFYYSDPLANEQSPFLTQGNVEKVDPVSGAPADTKVWKLAVA
ncbi:MAG: hypothetical protein NTZ56_13805, partial [Acidobacteria bacterium]|nr:hypothetical protein [Acidobacteriota bacterium]